MEADLAQMKLLLWTILVLQVVFVVGNILCRVIGCGERKGPDYADLLARGKVQEVLDQTKNSSRAILGTLMHCIFVPRH